MSLVARAKEAGGLSPPRAAESKDFSASLPPQATPFTGKGGMCFHGASQAPGEA